MSLISQSEFARRGGFSRQYVNKLIKKGKIKLINGMIDSETTLVTKASPDRLTSRRVQESLVTKNITELLARARLKNEIERGKILEAKAKAEINKLLSAEKVKKTAFTKARIVREKVLDVADRVSATLATIDNASQINEILTKELLNALEEFEDFES